MRGERRPEGAVARSLLCPLVTFSFAESSRSVVWSPSSSRSERKRLTGTTVDEENTRRIAVRGGSGRPRFTRFVSRKRSAEFSNRQGKLDHQRIGRAVEQPRRDDRSDANVRSVCRPQGCCSFGPGWRLVARWRSGTRVRPTRSFSTYGIGPSVRYYFGDMAGQLFPFLNASVIPIWQKTNVKNRDERVAWVAWTQRRDQSTRRVRRVGGSHSSRRDARRSDG